MLEHRGARFKNHQLNQLFVACPIGWVLHLHPCQIPEKFEETCKEIKSGKKISHGDLLIEMPTWGDSWMKSGKTK
jgi:hypothetical protein